MMRDWYHRNNDVISILGMIVVGLLLVGFCILILNEKDDPCDAQPTAYQCWEDTP